jgi:ribosome-associated protein
MTDDALVVNDRVLIPREELEYRATRSGGAGGQHVNTSSTRIELLWDLEGSRAVDDEGRERLRQALGARLDAEGKVRVVASRSRSQQQNRTAADLRLAALVRDALVVRAPRKKTRPSRAAKQARLADKKKRGDRKRDRKYREDG